MPLNIPQSFPLMPLAFLNTPRIRKSSFFLMIDPAREKGII